MSDLNSNKEKGKKDNQQSVEQITERHADDIVSPLREFGRGRYGCKHYRRRVKFVAPCCGEVFTCRHCHNEAKQQMEKDPAKQHELDRKGIKEVVCAVCDERQPLGTFCKACGVAFGEYACIKCPFFDDNLDKEPFHCDECGICRVGGREHYFHCSTCGSCYGLSLKDNHKCVERAMHQNCPVCFEYLFDSTEPTTVLQCGHTIHASCLVELERNSGGVCPSCPMCKKSLADFSEYWEMLDHQVANTPVPEEYRGWTVDIFCNDCSENSNRLPFNLIGHKCQHCGSYNTGRTRVTTPDGEDV